MKELLRIHVKITGCDTVKGGVQTVHMLHFTGECSSACFQGRTLPGGVDTQSFMPDGHGTLSARYILEGVDGSGLPCRLFIENNAVLRPCEAAITHPRITTDSEALRPLETMTLTGRIKDTAEGVDIIIGTVDE
ncbi:MAG: DUF3237 family protein [Clostridia bacterium]|nr:DUF3237 family protein [Clostridia bacterium]